MEATLTTTEIESLAKKVIDELTKRLVGENVYKELDKVAQARVDLIIKHYIDGNTLIWDVKKIIEPIFDKHLKESNYIDNKLSEYLNTKEFKKLELAQIERYASNLRRQLEEDYES